MPPIVIELDADTLALIDHADRRARDITQFQIPRLRDCKGPLSLQQQLNAELRDDMDALAQQIEALELAAGDVSGPPRRKIEEHVARLSALLALQKKDARAALLTSKRSIDAMSRNARDQLLQQRTPAADTRPEKHVDDVLMDTNSQITDALRRTTALMQAELERSVLSTQLLHDSTKTLRSTTTQHDSLTNLLSTSKTLVTALEKSDWVDRMLILASLAFFFIVVAFILKQRIIDRGLRIAFFWTRFIPTSPKDVLSQVEKGSAPVLAATVTTGLQTAISTAYTAKSTASVVTDSDEHEQGPTNTPLIDEIIESMTLSAGDKVPIATLRDEL